MSFSVHMYAPKGYYLSQTRRVGARRWRAVKGRFRSAKNAMVAAVREMRPDDKRARVLFMTYDGYHEPIQVMECVR